MTESGLDLLRHGGDVAFRRYVATKSERLAPGGFNQLHGILAVRKIGNRDMHAILGQSPGEGLADPAGATRNNGDLVLVTFGHCLLFPFCWSSKRTIFI